MTAEAPPPAPPAVMAPVQGAAVAARDFDVPAGPLSRSIILLGRQAGIPIGVFDRSMSGKRGRAVRGRMTVDQALRRLLQGTGLDFRRLPGGQILIVQAARPRRRPAPPPPPTRAEPPEPEREVEIVVTGSKRESPLGDYPAPVTIIDVDPRAGPATLTDGTNAIIDQVPVMASTYLGPGRDKIYIQGIADSSFAGHSMATVAQYLGEVRLTYNAPDPNLNLYDVKRVEVLEGPQATLYGAGSLGGILRLVPNDPETRRFEASMAAGLIATAHGGTGGDIAGMINIPVSDRIAVRAVGYHQVQPGYIDDSFRGLTDINRVLISGGRVTARAELAGDWTLDLGGVFQTIKGRDSQYAEIGRPPLTQETFAAQPYGHDYAMGQLTVRKDWGDLDLVSVTSYVKQDTLDVLVGHGLFLGEQLSIYRETRDISMVANETRLSGKSDRATFVAGVSSLYFTGDYGYTDKVVPCVAGMPCTPSIALQAETFVRNDVVDMSAFGEVDLSLSQWVSLTLGGRLEYTATDSDASAVISLQRSGIPIVQTGGSDRHVQFRAVPTVALSWKPLPETIIFARYQRSFRPGGFQLDLVDTFDQIGLSEFPSDHVDSVQFGFRYGGSHSPLAVSAAYSHSKWRNIQMDQLTANAGPSTIAGGDATIDGIRAVVTARPVDGLMLQGSLFANWTRRSRQEFEDGLFFSSKLPNIPNVGLAANAAYRFSPFAGGELTVRAAVRHTGESRTDPVISFEPNDEQPAYTAVNAGARLALGRFGVSLDVTNLGDVRGNRFLHGNPFFQMVRLQSTPLRPRSIRIGIDAAF